MTHESGRRPATGAEREPGQAPRSPAPVRPATPSDRLASVVSRIGNSNAGAWLGSGAQTTQPVSRPGDHDEREADSVADHITASEGPDPTTPTPDGGPLPAPARRFFEARLGADLSAVRVHHGERAHRAASAVGARAYTTGNDVTFANGQYAPGEPQGTRLLAHELTHVVQRQHGAPNSLRRQPFSDSLSPDDVIVRNAPVTPQQPSNDPLSRYPTLITALDSGDYETLERAVAAYRPYEPIPPTLRGTTCALDRLLDLDARPVDMGTMAGAVLPNLMTGSPDPLSLALVMRNEVLRRFLTQYYPLDAATVGIEIQRLIGPPQNPPPKAGATAPAPDAGAMLADPPELAFVIGEQTIPIGDGFLHLADLDRAVGGRVASIAAEVQQEVDKLADGASRILSARAASKQLPVLAAEMLMTPENFALAEVRALQTETNQLADALRALSGGSAGPDLSQQATELVAALLPGQAGLDGAVAAITALHQRTAVGATSKESADYLLKQAEEEKDSGNYFASYMMAKASGEQRAHSAIFNVVSGGAIDELDQQVEQYRAGNISLSAYHSLMSHTMIKAGLAIGISAAAGMLGGWVGGLAGRAVFGAGTIGASMTAGFGGGVVGGISFVGTQDVYSLTIASVSTDPYVKAGMRARVHSGWDYLVAGGLGGVTGTAMGGLLHSPAPGRTPPPIGSEPVTLLDAGGRPIRIQGGRILPTPPYRQPTLLGPDGVPLSRATGPTPMLVDPAGRPIGGPPSGATSTLTGQSRLVGPTGQPLSGGTGAVPPVLVDPYGRPITPTPPSGPLIVDLQSGTTTFLDDMTARTPGARGVGVESGRWLLGYQGIHPTHPSDLEMALGIARNAPMWPDTPAWRTPLGQTPRLLPWEIDPAASLFPSAGRVTVLPQAFFPAQGQGGRLVPWNIQDIPAGGIQPTTHPALAGTADQIYLRRPFGLGSADAGTTVALGQELNKMLKPGGFVEFRLRAQAELNVPAAGAGGVDQSVVVAGQIDNANVVRVDRGAILRFQRSGALPADPAQAAVLQNAADDVRGLGEGGYARIIRIYKGTR